MSESSTREFVLLERTDSLATVTIDRPERMNALNAQVLSELEAVFERLKNDASLRGVIVRGAGAKAFAAGADITEFQGLDAASARELSRRGQAVFDAIEAFPRPVVAAVDGYALGGGCELALACHLRVATKEAHFGFPEVSLGLIPGFGGTVRLPRLVGLGRALELILTGRHVDAVEAEAIGLVNAVVDATDQLLRRCEDLLERIGEMGPLAVGAAMRSIHHGLGVPSSDAMQEEAALFGLLADTEDMHEGVRAFLEKRRPEFTGR